MGPVASKASSTRCCNILKMRLGILIETGSEAMEAKIRGEIAIFKLLPVRVDMQL